MRGEICPGDEDWFSFSLTETSLVELDLAYDSGEGNLDLELLRVDGGMVARSVRLSSPEDITAERVLPRIDASLLTVKPEDFRSPVVDA